MERRLRTFYLKRRRYRIAANVVTVVGAAAGIIVTAAMWPTGPEGWLERHFLTAVIAAALILALVSRLIANVLWRLQLRRHYEEWG